MKRPIFVACPTCLAPKGEPCTQPTDTGRTKVQWFHLAREGLAREPAATDLEYLVVPDQGQPEWYPDYEPALARAKATLGAVYEVQMMADFGEQEL